LHPDFNKAVVKWRKEGKIDANHTELEVEFVSSQHKYCKIQIAEGGV
jgi:hypothetical protein